MNSEELRKAEKWLRGKLERASYSPLTRRETENALSIVADIFDVEAQLEEMAERRKPQVIVGTAAGDRKGDV